MLKSFLDRLTGNTPQETPATPEDERLAVAALLVHTARMDDEYTDDEKGLIEAILTHRYELSSADAKALLIDGEKADEASVDSFRFTQTIKDILPLEARHSVLEALWSVVLSDEARDPSEDALMRKLADFLGLSPHDSTHARMRIENAMKS